MQQDQTAQTGADEYAFSVTTATSVETIEITPDWQVIFPFALGLAGLLGAVVLAFLLRKRPPKRPESR